MRSSLDHSRWKWQNYELVLELIKNASVTKILFIDERPCHFKWVCTSVSCACVNNNKISAFCEVFKFSWPVRQTIDHGKDKVDIFLKGNKSLCWLKNSQLNVKPTLM